MRRKTSTYDPLYNLPTGLRGAVFRGDFIRRKSRFLVWFKDTDPAVKGAHFKAGQAHKKDRHQHRQVDRPGAHNPACRMVLGPPPKESGAVFDRSGFAPGRSRRSADGRVLLEMGTTWARGKGGAIDKRPLTEVGINLGQRLSVISWTWSPRYRQP
jgi:hypothetical protein